MLGEMEKNLEGYGGVMEREKAVAEISRSYVKSRLVRLII